MKLILSRKGFDSSAGKVASPILADGRMFSLPIPSKHAATRYQDITLCGCSLGDVVPELTSGRIRADGRTHLDPDLVASALPSRRSGWRGLFGQAGGAQTILAREGVGAGDVFLFFGWFRRAERRAGALRFAKGASNLHVLFAWLQIERVLDVASIPSAELPAWAHDHPHVRNNQHLTRNTLYVAAERLALDGVDTGLPGAGVFQRYDERLRLTKPDASRSLWSLPAWFEPQPRSKRPPLGCHADPTRWRRAGDRVELRSVARGQEFVLDADRYPEAVPWIRETVAIGR